MNSKLCWSWGWLNKSHSHGRNPIVLVPKQDSMTHFCTDFQKINATSKFNAYLMVNYENGRELSDIHPLKTFQKVTGKYC